MNLNRTSNVNSNKAKHTTYARLTSIFKKLENSIEEEKKKVKETKEEK